MGLEIGIGWLTLLLFGSLALLLMLGLPMAFCTGSLAVVFLYVVRHRRRFSTCCRRASFRS